MKFGEIMMSWCDSRFLCVRIHAKINLYVQSHFNVMIHVSLISFVELIIPLQKFFNIKKWIPC